MSLFGMGWDVESSGAGDVVPPVFRFLLGFSVYDGPVEGEYRTSVLLWSRGSCHILPSGITLTLALSHRRERGQDAPPWPPPGMEVGEGMDFAE